MDDHMIAHIENNAVFGHMVMIVLQVILGFACVYIVLIDVVYTYIVVSTINIVSLFCSPCTIVPTAHALQTLQC